MRELRACHAKADVVEPRIPAHGHSANVIRTVDTIKSKFLDFQVIAASRNRSGWR